jgi:hypothetical protein
MDLPNLFGKGMGKWGVAAVFFLILALSLNFFSDSQTRELVRAERECPPCREFSKSGYRVCKVGYFLFETPPPFARDWWRPPEYVTKSPNDEHYLTERRYADRMNKQACGGEASRWFFVLAFACVVVAICLLPFRKEKPLM